MTDNQITNFLQVANVVQTGRVVDGVKRVETGIDRLSALMGSKLDQLSLIAFYGLSLEQREEYLLRLEADVALVKARARVRRQTNWYVVKFALVLIGIAVILSLVKK